MKRTLLFLAVLTACIQSRATVVGFTNGDFDADSFASGASSDLQQISGWFDSERAFGAWLINQPAAFADGSVAGSGATNHLALTNLGGNPSWVYQQIGTYTPGESLVVSGDALNRAGYDTFRPVTFRLYSGSPSFASFLSDSVDVAGLGFTLLDTKTLAAPASFTDLSASAQSFAMTLDAGAAGVEGDLLVLEISTDAEGDTYLDNLSVSAVPEPASSGLVGASVLALVAGLRRRARRVGR